jgi:hypothetical protein
MGGSEPMQKGTQVRERQEILTIPRTGALIVEASIHESVLKQVDIGKPCSIQVDAIPGQVFPGRVTFIARLPDKASWWANPNQRLYKTEIAVLSPHIDMRPGMSCAIEILSTVIPNCLQVPLQAITLDGGSTVAFVSKGDEWEQRKVQVGPSSDKWVQVIEGLAEGEIVLLAAPPGFTPQPTPESAVPTDPAMPGLMPGMTPEGMPKDGMPAAGPDNAVPAADGAPPGPGRGGDRRGQRGGGKRPDGANRSGGPSKTDGEKPAEKPAVGDSPKSDAAPAPAETKPGSPGERRG